jgi:hypothetical protein
MCVLMYAGGLLWGHSASLLVFLKDSRFRHHTEIPLPVFPHPLTAARVRGTCHNAREPAVHPDHSLAISLYKPPGITRSSSFSGPKTPKIPSNGFLLGDTVLRTAIWWSARKEGPA